MSVFTIRYRHVDNIKFDIVYARFGIMESYRLSMIPYHCKHPLAVLLNLSMSAMETRDCILNVLKQKECQNPFTRSYVIQVANFIMEHKKQIDNYFIANVGV